MDSAPSRSASSTAAADRPSVVALAFDRPTMIGALKIAAVVGTILNLINQGDRLLTLRFGDVVWWRIFLTYTVPFCVSTFASTRIRLVDRARRAEAASHRALLERAYTAFNRRDIDGALAGMHADVEWPNGWEGGVVRGHAAVRDYWTRQWAAIDPTVQPVRFETEQDGRIAVEVRQTVRDLEGQVVRDDVVHHVYRLERGLVRSMEIRADA
jgi:ketosteroid isomerase-like protein